MLLLLAADQLTRVMPVEFAPAEQWKVEEVPPSRQDSDRDPSQPITLLIMGKRVIFKPKPGEWIFTTPGSDGSVLVHRSTRGIIWTDEFSIWFRGKESRIPQSASVYRDRLNYAGSVAAEHSAAPLSQTAPLAVAVQNGVRKKIGEGAVRHWSRDGAYVLEVLVDRNGHPTGVEFGERTRTTIIHLDRRIDLPDYIFMAEARDGTLTFQSNTRQILQWRNGKITAHWKLPNGWVGVGIAKGGWILAREGEPIKEEHIWRMGILRGGKLSRINFTRPKNSVNLLWRNGEEVYGDRAFRLNAFYGDTDRWYRFSQE